MSGVKQLLLCLGSVQEKQKNRIVKHSNILRTFKAQLLKSYPFESGIASVRYSTITSDL